MTEVVSEGNLVEALGGTVRQSVLVGKVEDIVERQKTVVLWGQEQLIRVMAVNIGLPVLLHLDQRFFEPDGLPAVGDVVVVDAVLRLSGNERGNLEMTPLTVARYEGLRGPIVDEEGKLVDDRVVVMRGEVLWHDLASWQFDAIENGTEALVVRSPNFE